MRLLTKIMNKIKIYMIEVRKSKNQRQYIAGYNLAAGHILRGEVFEELEMYIDCDVKQGRCSSFTTGIDDAIDKAQDMGILTYIAG
jgi:hypothetical protein